LLEWDVVTALRDRQDRRTGLAMPWLPARVLGAAGGA
jgi:hypothetical protein